jgi:hypothetical protein
MTTIIKSILKINPDAQVTVLDNDIDRIKWSDGNPTNITKEQILAKQKELQIEIEQEKQDAINKKASGKQKLLDLGLTEEEVKALIGV